MKVLVEAVTDIGLKKNINQDSFSVQVLSKLEEKIVFAIICDGMGGLSCGEIASASIIKAFSNWAKKELVDIIEKDLISRENLITNWIDLLNEYNKKIIDYSYKHNIKMGTTVTVFLLTKDNYYILHIGDTRVYEIKDKIKILTKDQTLIAREVELGKITKEEAKNDYRKNILLRCIGVSTKFEPDIIVGKTSSNTTYMLCSDGFRNKILENEIFEYLNPKILIDKQVINKNIKFLIDLNKRRNEYDNISSIVIKIL